MNPIEALVTKVAAIRRRVDRNTERARRLEERVAALEALMVVESDQEE